MIRVSAIAVFGVLCVAGTSAAAWQVNDQGDCVEVWTPASLLRGPIAVANTSLLPMRYTAGPVEMLAYDQRTLPTRAALKEGFLLVPPLTALSGMLGVNQSLFFLGGGLADTVTGGYYTIAPEAATEVSLYPVPVLFLEDPRHPDEPQTDRCGRPLK